MWDLIIISVMNQQARNVWMRLPASEFKEDPTGTFEQLIQQATAFSVWESINISNNVWTPFAYKRFK